MLLNPAKLVTLLLIVPLTAATPGADMMYILSHTEAGRPRRGLVAVAGIFGGLLVFAAAVGLGLGSLFVAWPVLYDIVRIAGVAYLLYLACGFWQAGRRPVLPVSPETSPAEKAPAARIFLKGMLINLTNPKSAIFFLAFLPEFVDASLGHLRLQLFALGLAAIMIGCSVYLGLTLIVSLGLGRVCRPSGHWLQRLNFLLAAIFAGLAAELAVAHFAP